MKTLYIECNMGAAGDMLMAALLELSPDPEVFLKKMNSLVPGIEVKRSESVKCGIKGTHISVIIRGEEEQVALPLEEHAHPHNHTHSHDHDHDRPHEHDHHHDHDHPHVPHHDNPHDHPHGAEVHEHHHHSGIHDIEDILSGLAVSDNVKKNALAVYQLIAEAESHAHGVPVDEIHFHEVGQLDAVMDITGVCMMMEQLSPERIIVSPIHVGSGQVKTAHGILPVPAPATAHILEGAPIYSRGIRGELCTPTGAALLKHFAQSFSEMPTMKIEKIGYGMGTKDFEAANCVRVLFGQSGEASANDEIAELSCNLDDMPPEAIGYALKQLLSGGAVDAFITPIQMKKNRPAQMLTCLCRKENAAEVAKLMLKHTTTIGVRQSDCKRYILQSTFQKVETPYGAVTIKVSEGYGTTKCKPEFDDVARLAKEHGVPFDTVYRAALHKQS